MSQEKRRIQPSSLRWSRLLTARPRCHLFLDALTRRKIRERHTSGNLRSILEITVLRGEQNPKLNACCLMSHWCPTQINAVCLFVEFVPRRLAGTAGVCLFVRSSRGRGCQGFWGYVLYDSLKAMLLWYYCGTMWLALLVILSVFIMSSTFARGAWERQKGMDQYCCIMGAVLYSRFMGFTGVGGCHILVVNLLMLSLLAGTHMQERARKFANSEHCSLGACNW